MQAAMAALTVVMAGWGIGAKAQIYVVNEGFEGATFPPNGWTILDNDGDGHCWTRVGRGYATLNGQGIAMSYTVDPDDPKSSYGEQDNYLITPQIDVKNESYQLSFKYCAEDIQCKEQMEVRISTTGKEAKDFTDVLYKETVDNGYDDDVTLQSLTRSLKDYAGKKIYIAFVHKGSGSYALGIDDVSVTNQNGPKKATGLSVKAGEQGALTATLQWTNPSTTGTGAALGRMAAGIYRDAHLIHTMDEGLEPGGTSTYTDNDVTTGRHVYAVVIGTAEGQSAPVSASVYVGEDIPSTVTGLTATPAEGKVKLSWTAPTEGAGKGYIDTKALTYNVTRNTPTDTTLVATALKVTAYEDASVPGVLTSYTVSAANNAGVGEGAVSNAIITFSQAYKDVTAGSSANVTDYSNPKLPIDASSKRTLSQTLYYPDDLGYLKGEIKTIVYKSSFRNTDVKKPLKIFMAETDKADLKDGWLKTADMTKVFEDTVLLKKGENDVPITLGTPFNYTGKNLVICVQMDFVPQSGSYFDRFYVEQTPDKPGRARLYDNYSEYDPDQLTPSDGSAAAALPLTRFIVDAKGVASLSGTVSDSRTGNRIAGVKVAVDGLALSTVTDANGRYDFYIVPSGAQKISLTAKGYHSQTFDLDVQDGGSQTADFTLKEMDTYSVSGKVMQTDTKQPMAGAAVVLGGYTEATTTTAADGSFKLEGVYAGEDYTLRVEKSLYDVYATRLNATQNVDLGEIALNRSLITPYGVEGAPTADGSAVELTWHDPLSRTGKTQWTHWGNSDENDDTSGDYYSSDDFNVGHAFAAADVEQLGLAGQSFTRLKVYIKATEGVFTAHVWRGTTDNPMVLASKVIPADSISAEGKWVTVDFDAPGVEIRPGTDYIVGLNVKNASSNPIGCAGSGSRIEGKNNLRWSANPYSSNYYYAWNISAYCSVPGTELPLDNDGDVQKCSYDVYRTSAVDGQRTKLNEAPLQNPQYTDKAWGTLPSGKYIYGVTALYRNGESLAAVTDTIVRSVNTDVAVTAFLSPVKSAELQKTVEVKVTITNLGEKPVTNVPVYYTVNGGTPKGETWQGTLAKGETADVTLGTVDVSKDGVYTFKAYTAVDGDEAPANDTLSFVLPNFTSVNLYGYRWDAYGNAGIMRINSNKPEQATFVVEVTPDEALLNAGEYVDGKLYAYTSTWYSDPRSFVALDTLNWQPTRSAETTEFIQDMAYDYATKTMYALRLDKNISQLVTVSLTDGSTTLVGSTGTNLHALACNTDGQFYAIDDSGNLCTVDKTTARLTVVGATGVTDVKYLQSMAFDHNTGRLFWSQTGTQTTGYLYEIDPQTAVTTPLGTVNYGKLSAEIIALYTVYNHKGSGVDNALKDTTRVSVTARYAADGRRLSAPEKGVNILKLSDGRTIKQVVK